MVEPGNRKVLLAALLLSGAVLIDAGGGAASASPATVAVTRAAAPSAEAAEAETARLNAWFDARNDEALAASPMARTGMGDKRDYDKIDDMSKAAQDRSLEWRRKTVEDLKAHFNRARLTPDGQLSYDLWIDQYERAAEAAKFRRNDYIFTQLQGPQASLAQFLIASHRVSEASDMDAYVARIGGISRALGQLQARAKLNAEAGSRPPLFAYDGAIQQARALISGAPFAGAGDSPIWADANAKIDGLVKAGKIDPARAQALRDSAKTALLTKWGPAYQRLIDWLEADKVHADKIATGVGKNPNGAAYFAMRLRNMTTTDLTPEQVHQFGLSEVARIHAEMAKIQQQVGFHGTLQEFFTYVRENPKFYYPSTDEGRQAYIAAVTADLEAMKKKLPAYFGILPKADLVVKRVEPYREQAGAVQFYANGTADGTRPGVFYMHLIDMRAMPIPQLEVAAYHEGIPGHHLQISIAQELTNVPKFRSRLVFAAFLEGWGLYSEQLAKEMGAYQDPYSDFGRLTLEEWRAIRCVLDTGIHAKGWTEEQAVQYMHDNAPLTDGQIRSEVRRYIVSPGVASSYKIGMREILRLREKAKAELGDRFDIRGFHDTVLGGGALPLDMLDRRVDAWIAAQKAGEGGRALLN
ncbi:MAG: DUF885 domain-containing protein [Proteobacteria bacterium]|nr:DUF885 domain-containing protein [Pseudomonadota bacterium]